MIKVFCGDTLLLDKIRPANHFISRLRGLMFYKEWPGINGLLLVPCNSVHMFWMNFSLDLIYLDRKQKIVLTAAEIAPGKIGPTVKEAHSVLEAPVGTIARFDLKSGDILSFKCPANFVLPI